MGLYDGSGSGLGWGDVINAAIAIYNHQQASKAPKFYTAPSTPADAWTLGQKQNLYNYAAPFTDQFLRSISSMPSPKFDMHGTPATWATNPLAGIDWSKMTAPNQAPPAGTGTGGSGGGGGTTETGGKGGAQSASGTSGDPFGGMGSALAGTLTSAGMSQFTKDFSPGGSYWTPDGSQATANVAKWLSKYGTAFGLAAGAIGGPVAALLAKGAQSLANWYLGNHTMGGAVPSNYTGSNGIASLTPGSGGGPGAGGGSGNDLYGNGVGGGMWMDTGQGLGGAPVSYYYGSLTPGGGGGGDWLGSDWQQFATNLD